MKRPKKYSDQIKTGVWIDHQRAIIVSIHNNEIKTDEILTGVISHERFKGETTDKTNSGAQVMNREIHKEAKQQHKLKKFYESIIDKILSSSHLYIFGPAEAKFDLQNQVAKHKTLKNLPVVVAPADNRNMNEIVADVKKYYT